MNVNSNLEKIIQSENTVSEILKSDDNNCYIFKEDLFLLKYDHTLWFTSSRLISLVFD